MGNTALALASAALRGPDSRESCFVAEGLPAYPKGPRGCRDQVNPRRCCLPSGTPHALARHLLWTGTERPEVRKACVLAAALMPSYRATVGEFLPLSVSPFLYL